MNEKNKGNPYGELGDKWVILWSESHYKRKGYPIHVEQIKETIESNLQNNFNTDSKTLDWHIIGIFETSKEAMDYGAELAIKMGVIIDDETPA